VVLSSVVQSAASHRFATRTWPSLFHCRTLGEVITSPLLVPLAGSCQDLGHDCNARLRASGHSDASAGAHLPRTGMPHMQPHGDSRQPSRQSCSTLMVCNPLDHSWRGHRIFPPPLCAVVMMQVRLRRPPESFGTFRRLGGLPSQATGRPPNLPALPPGASSLQLASRLRPRQST